jgi:hypothetical protein
MDRPRLHSLVAELDAAVPKGHARVMINLYDSGPDECSMVANEAGYLRFGVEMLKAAFAPPGLHDRADAIPVEVDYLFTEDSEVHLNWFERREPDAPPADTGWSLRDFAVLAFSLFLVALAAIGLITLFTWLGAHLTSRL